jgi:hypothetical protein
LFSAECYFQTEPKAKSFEIADCLVDLAKTLCAQGYTSADIFLDNNPTHKHKMKTDFYQMLDVPMTIRFHHFPSYSPLCNPTEYLIHLIRQKHLHHHDYKLNLQELEKISTDNLLGKTFISKEQMVNILEHIHNLVLSP